MNISHIDHVVLMVKSIERTEKFYKRFLGEPEFVDAEQVCWKIGETKIFFGLPYNTYAPYDKDTYGMNHLAFRVRDRAELEAAATMLSEAQVAHSGIQQDKYSGNEFVWLDDPDGYRIEFYVRA